MGSGARDGECGKRRYRSLGPPRGAACCFRQQCNAPEVSDADHLDDLQHPKHSPDFVDATLEFGAGDSVRCKLSRLRGPGEPEARQRMIAVERIG